jgi:hypothetical protein
LTQIFYTIAIPLHLTNWNNELNWRVRKWQKSGNPSPTPTEFFVSKDFMELYLQHLPSAIRRAADNYV